MYTSLFDSFFAPTRVIVVSEERLQQAEREAKENQLKSVEARINELNEYKESLSKELKALTPSEDSK
jgi:DNA-binding protein H-NS